MNSMKTADDQQTYSLWTLQFYDEYSKNSYTINLGTKAWGKTQS